VRREAPPLPQPAFSLLSGIQQPLARLAVSVHRVGGVHAISGVVRLDRHGWMVGNSKFRFM